MYAKIHVIWTSLRPDLKKGTSDYKEGLYMLAEAELKKPQIGSLTELTLAELSKLIQVLEHEQAQPPLYRDSGNIVPFKSSKGQPDASISDQVNAPVEHLASLNQRFAISKLFGYLGWGDYGRGKFLEKNFRCKRAEMLLHKQAHSCINILLRCAASKYWKDQGKQPVSTPMINAAIPRIKREIGID